MSYAHVFKIGNGNNQYDKPFPSKSSHANGGRGIDGNKIVSALSSVAGLTAGAVEHGPGAGSDAWTGVDFTHAPGTKTKGRAAIEAQLKAAGYSKVSGTANGSSWVHSQAEEGAVRRDAGESINVEHGANSTSLTINHPRVSGTPQGPKPDANFVKEAEAASKKDPKNKWLYREAGLARLGYKRTIDSVKDGMTIATYDNPGLGNKFRSTHDGKTELRQEYWNPKAKSWEVVFDDTKEGVKKAGTKFDALVAELMEKQGKTLEEAKALAAWIGRKKYGPAGFAELAAQGRARMAKDDQTDQDTDQVLEDDKDETTMSNISFSHVFKDGTGIEVTTQNTRSVPDSSWSTPIKAAKAETNLEPKGAAMKKNTWAVLDLSATLTPSAVAKSDAPAEALYGLGQRLVEKAQEPLPKSEVGAVSGEVADPVKEPVLKWGNGNNQYAKNFVSATAPRAKQINARILAPSKTAIGGAQKDYNKFLAQDPNSRHSVETASNFLMDQHKQGKHTSISAVHLVKPASKVTPIRATSAPAAAVGVLTPTSRVKTKNTTAAIASSPWGLALGNVAKKGEKDEVKKPSTLML